MVYACDLPFCLRPTFVLQHWPAFTHGTDRAPTQEHISGRHLFRGNMMPSVLDELLPTACAELYGGISGHLSFGRAVRRVRKVLLRRSRCRREAKRRQRTDLARKQLTNVNSRAPSPHHRRPTIGKCCRLMTHYIIEFCCAPCPWSFSVRLIEFAEPPRTSSCSCSQGKGTSRAFFHAS